MTDTITIETNGLAFTTRVTGPVDGEPVVFLHGFPDTPATFDHQVEALAAEGFRCLVPTMRGYEPSSQPTNGDYSLTTLATDVVGWLDAQHIDRAHIVGHDWGAAVAYVLAAHHGDRCRSVTALAIPPLQRIPEAVRKVPKQLVLSWYMTYFQTPGVAERSLMARDWRLLRWFWPRWSPGLDAPADLVTTFEQPGVLGAALAYYRQNATPPLLLGIRTNAAMELRPSGAPVLIVHGDRDGCMDPRLFDHTIIESDHPHGVRHERLAGVGHFLHHEDPARINSLLLEWFASAT